MATVLEASGCGAVMVLADGVWLKSTSHIQSRLEAFHSDCDGLIGTHACSSTLSGMSSSRMCERASRYDCHSVVRGRPRAFVDQVRTVVFGRLRCGCGFSRNDAHLCLAAAI